MFKIVLFALPATLLLTSCGISGPLETAPPMWGRDRAAYEAQKAKEEAARKQKDDAATATETPAAPATKP